MGPQNGISTAISITKIKKSMSCKLGKEIALTWGVMKTMSAQGTVVAPRKDSSNFFPIPTL
jgi:hypothetical protein